jgi:hypothetical protein
MEAIMKLQTDDRPEMDKSEMEPTSIDLAAHWLLMSEMNDTTHHQQCKQLDLTLGVTQQWQQILAAHQNESTDYRGARSISFDCVAMGLAKHISQCLADYPLQKRNVPYILSLLRDYKVVGFLPGKNHTVSLHKVHLILQDNYPDSWLCGLMNELLAGVGNGISKTVCL